jgi:hypothetical protein
MPKMNGLACALAIGTFGWIVALPAHAEQQCAPRDQVVKVLNAKFQENQRAMGLINERTMMEVYISPRGTWTMVVTNENGMTCVLAAGEAWDELPTAALGPAS